MSWRDQIAAEARTWLGTKYHHKGRIKGVGVDCGGLIYETYKKVLGIPAEPFPSDYPEDWGLHKEDNELYLNFIMPYVKPTMDLKIGDLVIFKFGRAFAHGTMYIGGGKVIHSYGRTTHGAVLISPMNKFNVGASLRPRRYFTLDDKWLSLPQTL